MHYSSSNKHSSFWPNPYVFHTWSELWEWQAAHQKVFLPFRQVRVHGRCATCRQEAVRRAANPRQSLHVFCHVLPRPSSAPVDWVVDTRAVHVFDDVCSTFCDAANHVHYRRKLMRTQVATIVDNHIERLVARLLVNPIKVCCRVLISNVDSNSITFRRPSS